MAIEEYDQWLSSISLAISVGIGLAFGLTQWSTRRKHQQYIKKTINNNIRDLVRIIEILNNKTDNTYEDNQVMKNVYIYFSRKVDRLRLLRLNVENLLTQLTGNDEYKQEITAILNIESWMMETFDRTMDDEKKYYLWKRNSEKLMNKTRSIVTIATKLKIITPVVVS